MKIIDTPEFQRLARISQLGLVSMVYPAANHNRFEHSLGVYRMTLLVLRHLGANDRFNGLVSAEQGTLLILAALLHDIGHWPFCHPIEDLGLPQIPAHESFARAYVLGENLSRIIEQEFHVSPTDVIGLIEHHKTTQVDSLLCSILSGPIDVDKLDYLYRDSLHAGVPYGQNFDTQRLVGSLCLNESGDRLAITHKGKTAAELMVFARYVMFSEVYWHHAVRSATAMLQRGFYWLVTETEVDVDSLFRNDDPAMISELVRLTRNTPVAPLLDSLFGPRRNLHKRLTSFSCLENEELYRSLAQQPYPRLLEFSRELGRWLAAQTGMQVGEHDVIIDAPPVGLEVQFDVDVFYPRNNEYRSLGEVSPVVSTLANRQFDDFVKQVRVFVHPRLREATTRLDVEQKLTELSL